MTVAYVIMALCVVLGVPFTLWWWKEADKWASAEHRKFKPRAKEDLSGATVVHWKDSKRSPGEGEVADADADGSGDGGGGDGGGGGDA